MWTRLGGWLAILLLWGVSWFALLGVGWTIAWALGRLRENAW